MKRSKGILWSALVVMLLLASCGSSGSSIPACALSGTITDNSGGALNADDLITVAIEIGLPISATGPYERQTTLTWPGVLTAGYLLDIGSLAPGDYYVVAVKDTTYWGYSGPTGIDCGSTVNVSITENPALPR